MMKVGISMFNILQSTQLSSNTFDFWLEAPRIATHAQAGQFVILRIERKGERSGYRGDKSTSRQYSNYFPSNR